MRASSQKESTNWCRSTVVQPTASVSLDSCDTSESGGFCVIAHAKGKTPQDRLQAREATTTTQDSLIRGKSSPAALRDAALGLRMKIRSGLAGGKAGSGPLTMAVSRVKDDVLHLAWTGDVACVRVRDHSHEFLAIPARSGHTPYSTDPLGGNPAETKRRLRQRDLIVISTGSCANTLIDDKHLLHQLDQAQNLDQARSAASAACARTDVTSGICYLARVNQSRGHRLRTTRGGYHDSNS